MSKKKGKGIQLRFTYNMALFLIALVMFLSVGIARNNFFSRSYIIETVKQIIEI